MTQARTLSNRYELQSKIGDGGMAAVYKALDLRLNRVVALKVLRESYASDPQFLARFKREAEQAASLNHPNIARVFDVGDDGDIHYIVMELIEGTSLKEMIVREAPLPTARALEIGAEICDAIAYAHSTGLIHRDIKPQNILLDKSGRVKVVDFGIAKSSNTATLTEAGITLGTVHYFSPEQAKGQAVLPQSDIYSIGVVLFEMLTGHIPFDSDNPVALALKHIEEQAPSPRRYNASIPPVVEQIVLRTLAKDPTQRYSSADQLGKALRTVETQSEQGTTAVPIRPTPTNPNQTYNNSNAARPVGPNPGPSQTFSNANTQRPNPNNGQTVRPQPNYGPQDATYVNPVRPASPNPQPRPLQPQPAQYNTYQPETVERQGYPAQNGVRNYPDNATRNRPPVYEREERYDEVTSQRGAGCLPWFIGTASFLMVAALIVGFVVLLPNLTAPKPNAPTSIPTQANSTPVPLAKIKVPSVAGKTQADAEKAIKDANLQVGEIKQENSNTVEAGKVIATSPAIGTSVDASSKVGLTISKGKDVVPLISYKNTPPDAAQKQLESLGFKVERVQEFNDDIQAGAVIRTEPAGGDGVTVARGSNIKIIVSKGPNIPTATPIPPTATSAPATATPVPATATATAVPPTNTPAATPTPTVKPNPVTVPQVYGRARSDGEKIIKDAGFSVRVVEWDENDLRRQFANDAQALEQALKSYSTLQKGQILGTSPAGDTTANKGSEITIAVKK